MGQNGRSALRPLLWKIAFAIFLYWSIWVLRDYPWWYIAFFLVVVTYYFVVDPVRRYRRERSYTEAQHQD